MGAGVQRPLWGSSRPLVRIAVITGIREPVHSAECLFLQSGNLRTPIQNCILNLNMIEHFVVQQQARAPGEDARDHSTLLHVNHNRQSSLCLSVCLSLSDTALASA